MVCIYSTLLIDGLNNQIYSFLNRLGADRPMSNRQLTLTTPTHSIDLFYRRKVYAKENYALSSMTIEAKNSKTFMKAELDEGHPFRHFQNLAEFYQYILANKKKELFAVDDKGFFSVGLMEDNKQVDSEVINLTEAIFEVSDEEEPNHLQPEVKSRAIRKLEKDIKSHLREQRKNKKEIKNQGKKKGNAHIQGGNVNASSRVKLESITKVDPLPKLPPIIREIVFTKVDSRDSYELCKDISHVSFETSLAELENSSFKLKLDKIRNQKIVIGLIFNNKEGKMGDKRMCEFTVTSWGNSISALEGHVLEISYEDGELLIRNMSNNNGKMFELSANNEQLHSQCQVKVSMESF